LVIGGIFFFGVKVSDGVFAIADELPVVNDALIGYVDVFLGCC
jgi:hypothetical protein